jgi:hypothetical protein
MKTTHDVTHRLMRHLNTAIDHADAALYETYQWLQTLQALPALLVGTRKPHSAATTHEAR